MKTYAGKAVSVLENMRLTLGAMARLEKCKALFFEEASFAVATGVDSASENRAFFPIGVSQFQVNKVCSFYNRLGMPFIFPLFPGADRKILEEAGMAERGKWSLMVRSPAPTKGALVENLAVESLTFEVNKETDDWAETAWAGFDSPPGVPGAFVDLARGLRSSEGIFLILAKSGGKNGTPVGTVMLSLGNSTAGVYYFATLPSKRRKGIGEAMLNEAARITCERGYSLLTLQATPKGVPFYASQGFESLYEVPVYSFSDDVF